MNLDTQKQQSPSIKSNQKLATSLNKKGYKLTMNHPQKYLNSKILYIL